MESAKVEDYLKAIYRAGGGSDPSPAATGAVAELLGITPGSVTTMLQRLAESGLVDYQAHRGARLTEQGMRAALKVLRRHRLVELFLVRTLGLTWDEVHEEAEHLEHAISDRLIDRIDEYLGFPARDPHGDPIPHADGSERTTPGDPLSELGRGARFRLVRVLDQSPEFLRYLAEGGLELGAAAVVVNLQPSAGIIQIRANGRTISLSCEMARRLLIEKTA